MAAEAKSSWEEVTIASPADFDKSIADLASKAASKVVILLYGDWCPDCRDAEPVIREQLEKIADPKLLLVRCPVVKEDYKGNPKYPYRTHERLKLKAIPSLYVWPKSVDAEVPVLIEEDCKVAELVADFLKITS